MLYNQPSPLETKVLSRRFGLANSESLETYLANDGYQALPGEGRPGMHARTDHRRSESVEPSQDAAARAFRLA